MLKVILHIKIIIRNFIIKIKNPYCVHLDSLIIDLAFILILAAVTTIIFKWLKQPVVLGYIVAGYLAGGHSTLLPTIHGVTTINTWADIGIIFLLFGLGLEFSFKKLIHVGGTAVTAAVVIVCGMMSAGFLTGQLLGWNITDSVFLGGMLSMSSTTIIIKAFNDLGMRGQKFTTVVFGVLVVEDMFAVVMMVILSSIYVGSNVAAESGALEVAWSVVKLLFFLVVWFGVGIALIPSILRKARRFLSGETLLIVSLGLCLGMVVFANAVGLSSALGAFVMGSILAETVEAKDIARITMPIRDLFGAVFFISVGMLVDPTILMEYWVPILIITAIVIVGQIVFASTGVLLSGQGLKVAIESGFSLAQIGEFAFIIATLGLTLGVTSGFLYPVAVAVAVITTFTTPFVMRLSGPAYRLLDARLPQRAKGFIARFSPSSGDAVNGDGNVLHDSGWPVLIKQYVLNLILMVILLMGTEWVLITYIIPAVRQAMSDGWFKDAVLTVGSLMVIAPLVWALVVRRVESATFLRLWRNSKYNRGVIILLVALRIVLALGFVMFILVYIHSYRIGVLTGVGMLTIILMLFSRRIQGGWLRFERRFERNIDSNKSVIKIGSTTGSNDLHLTHVTVSPDCQLCGRTLKDITIRQLYNVGLINIRRGSSEIPVPDSYQMLMPYDELTVVGPNAALRSFTNIIEQQDDALAGDVHGGNGGHGGNSLESEVVIESFHLGFESALISQTVAESMIRQRFSCMIVWIDRANGQSVPPASDTEFKTLDVVWLAGALANVREVVERYGDRSCR